MKERVDKKLIIGEIEPDHEITSPKSATPKLVEPFVPKIIQPVTITVRFIINHISSR